MHNKIAFIAPLLVASASFADAQTPVRVFATSVPQVPDWTREARATGIPPNTNCDQSNPDYAINDAGQTWLVAADFEPLVLQGNQVPGTVTAGAMVRFDMGEPADIRFRASWTSDSGGARSEVITVPLSNGVGNGSCAWRPFDLTGFEPSWSTNEVDSIVLEVRRRNNYPNNRLRVKGFRVVVQPLECMIADGCAAAANVTGAGTRLDAAGVPRLSSSITLNVSSAPPLQFGLFWWGAPASAPAASGNGLLCISGPQRVTDIVQTNGAGAAAYAFDLGIPEAFGVLPGATLAVQFQHRDPQGPAATRWNWSESLLLTVCP